MHVLTESHDNTLEGQCSIAIIVIITTTTTIIIIIIIIIYYGVEGGKDYDSGDKSDGD